MQTVFDAAGRNDGLRRLAYAWHKRVMADDVVAHAFSHGFHPQHVERLAAYWAEALGGPTTYSDSYGDETTVIKIHSGNGEHDEMDRRAIACFDLALADVGLAKDDVLRQSVMPLRSLLKGTWIYVEGRKEQGSLVGRWFTEFWGPKVSLNIVDELAAPDMLLQYSLHELRRGHEDIKAFMRGFREAFPDLNFWGAADFIAEGDYVVGRWKGGGTHTGPAFSDFLNGSLPACSGRKMHFTGTTVLRIKDGKIVEEVGLDDGVTALTQLGLIRAA